MLFMSKILLLVLAFGIATTLGFTNAFAASDYFLKIEGVDGESRDEKHKGEIQIESWSWGVSNSGSMAAGSGGGAGKVSFQDFHFTKTVDKSSPLLFQAAATGEHYKQATMTVRKAGGDQVEYMTITFSDLLVTSITATGGQDSVPTESISFNFSKIEFQYQPIDDVGRASESPVKAGYDLATNKKI
jgi:type VI secretion system secreted protein Hcp